MKCVYIILFVLLTNHWCLGQETVKRSRTFGPNIKEQFEVLKSDKKIRTGAYEAVLNNQKIALGRYIENKRAGHWTFFNDKGKLVQHYNYSNKQLLYNDSSDVKNIRYLLTDSLKDGDIVVYPVKIGGYNYGLAPILESYKSFIEKAHLHFGQPDYFDIEDVFTLNADGKMTKHEINFLYDGQIKTYVAQNGALNDDDTEFFPGTLNGSPTTFKFIVGGRKLYFQSRLRSIR
jgi:hypothetical protein